MQMAHHDVTASLAAYRILGAGNKLEPSLGLIRPRHALPFLVVVGFPKPCCGVYCVFGFAYIRSARRFVLDDANMNPVKQLQTRL